MHEVRVRTEALFSKVDEFALPVEFLILVVK